MPYVLKETHDVYGYQGLRISDFEFENIVAVDDHHLFTYAEPDPELDDDDTAVPLFFDDNIDPFDDLYNNF